MTKRNVKLKQKVDKAPVAVGKASKKRKILSEL